MLGKRSLYGKGLCRLKTFKHKIHKYVFFDIHNCELAERQTKLSQFVYFLRE